MKYLISIIISFFVFYLYAAEPLQEKESVFIYCDSVYSGAFKDMKSQFKDILSARKVSWKVKASKSVTFTSLAENIEKELLKSKADRFILALGTSEFWDAKKKVGLEFNEDSFKKSVQNIIQTLQMNGKKVHLCTPHQILAGKSDEANHVLSTASQTLLASAKAAGISCSDLYKGFEQKNSSGESKRMKGITTKDGYKLNDNGESIITAMLGQALSLSATALTRDLREGDIVVFLGPCNPNLMKNFSVKLKEHYKDMKFLAPRALSIYLSHDIFSTKIINREKIKINKPTVLFIYPGATILGKKNQIGSLDDGTFKSMFKEKIERLRSDHPQSQFFICTPLVHREDDAANLVKIGGEHYKLCEKWAGQTKEVADDLGLPVLDIHRLCIEWINANGAENAKFAGAKSTYINEFETQGYQLIIKAIAKAINFDAYTE